MTEPLDADLSNLHPREDVPFARLLAEVLAATHFLDDELLALFGTDHFGSDGRAFHQRRAKFRIARTADCQDRFEIELSAGRHIPIADKNFLPFFNSVLAASVTNDGVHNS